MDHCLPWSAWPCWDLWNLLFADQRMNQQSKRDRLPSADAIAAWWQAAYLRPEDAVLPGRFAAEACASLPGLDVGSTSHLDDVQAAVALQRMRLRQDQGVPEWSWRP